MSEDEVKRLGEPYFSTKTNGTGLGTMVAFKIIRDMNGTIKVSSVKEKGTNFKIVFQR